MRETLPRTALLLGLAGLIPFLGGIGLAALAEGASRGQALWALATYGAVILSFLGAVHWGLALARDESPATAARLLLGVVPALVGWVALLLPPVTSLVLLASGILGTAAAETGAARRGLVGAAYLRLRWGLSLVAMTCLLAGALLAA